MLDITLESLLPAHADELYPHILNNQAKLAQWLPWMGDIKTLEDVTQYIVSVNEAAARNEILDYLIRYQGQICGSVNLGNLDYYNGTASIGYWLTSSATGKGIATAAVMQILNIGFVDKNLHKLEIHCAERNIRSRRIPERLGFVHEANLRQCQWINNKRVNHAVYSQLATEYFAKKQVATG